MTGEAANESETVGPHTLGCWNTMHTNAMTYEKAVIIGSSTEGFTAAADDAIAHARDRYDEVKWAEVEFRGVELASVEEPVYQVEATIAYGV